MFGSGRITMRQSATRSSVFFNGETKRLIINISAAILENGNRGRELYRVGDGARA